MTLSKTFPFVLNTPLIPQTSRSQHPDSLSHTHTHTHRNAEGRKIQYIHKHTHSPVLWANRSCESAIGNVATKASTWYAGICFVAYLHCSTVQSNCCLAGPARKLSLFSPPTSLRLLITSSPPLSLAALFSSAVPVASPALNRCLGIALLELFPIMSMAIKWLI